MTWHLDFFRDFFIYIFFLYCKWKISQEIKKKKKKKMQRNADPLSTCQWLLARVQRSARHFSSSVFGRTRKKEKKSSSKLPLRDMYIYSIFAFGWSAVVREGGRGLYGSALWHDVCGLLWRRHVYRKTGFHEVRARDGIMLAARSRWKQKSAGDGKKQELLVSQFWLRCKRQQQWPK